MAKRPWDGIIPEEELAIYKKAGFGGSSGLGKRPALLIIDLYNMSYRGGPKPVSEVVKEFPSACGVNAFNAIEKTLRAEEGIANELDYVEQTSWVLFLKYLHDLESERRDQAATIKPAQAAMRQR